MPSKRKLFTKFISPLYFHLQSANIAYKKYLTNRIFVHAAVLYKVNKRIASLISDQNHLIPAELREDCLQLLNHYDIWFAQFRLHKKKLNPSAADTFVFEQADDQCAFPAAAEKKIINCYLGLQRELQAEFAES